MTGRIRLFCLHGYKLIFHLQSRQGMHTGALHRWIQLPHLRNNLMPNAVTGIVICQVGTVRHKRLLQFFQHRFYILPGETKQRSNEKRPHRRNATHALQSTASNQTMHSSFKIVRSRMCRCQFFSIRKAGGKCFIPANSCCRFNRAVLRFCICLHVPFQQGKRHVPLRTKRPAKCSIPFTFCSAQMMVNVYRSNGQLHGIFLLQQQTQQTDTVCSTGPPAAPSGADSSSPP